MLRDAARDDPVLPHLKRALGELYGDRMRRALLFGSRARGEARPDSDDDVAVFLTSLPDRWVELDRLAALRVSLIDETGAFLDAWPYQEDAFHERSPLMAEICRDGVEL